MNEGVVVALITLVGTIAAALLASYANIRAAEIEALKHDHSEAEKATIRAVIVSTRKKTLKIGVVIALLVSVVAGFLADRAVSSVKKSITGQILGDFRVFKLSQSISTSHVSDPLIVAPWRQGKGTNSLLSIAKVAGRGVDGALRISPEPSKMAKGFSAAGVRLERADLPMTPSTLIVGWVYVEKNESAVAADLRARIVTNIENDDGAFIYTEGEEAKLVPGEWTPIVWARNSDVFFWDKGQERIPGSERCKFKNRGNRFSSVEVHFSAIAGPYVGSLYVDELNFYTVR